jgi:hypothetical protein
MINVIEEKSIERNIVNQVIHTRVLEEWHRATVTLASPAKIA